MPGLLACNNPEAPSHTAPAGDSITANSEPSSPINGKPPTSPKPETDTLTKQHQCSNETFKDVSVRTISTDSFEVSGKARVFEAAFSWVIEDGHQELKTGHEMTDAGAPAWGAFRFRFRATKARPNSTLTLILFEASAKDGSRQHELPIPLNQA